MEYSKRYKNEQGAVLEITLKAECATGKDMDDALRLISVGLHYFYQEMVKTWGRVQRLDIESFALFVAQLKKASTSFPSEEKKLVEMGCNLLAKQLAGLGGEWEEAFRYVGEQKTGG